jgi:hypothetical protein
MWTETTNPTIPSVEQTHEIITYLPNRYTIMWNSPLYCLNGSDWGKNGTWLNRVFHLEWRPYCDRIKQSGVNIMDDKSRLLAVTRYVIENCLFQLWYQIHFMLRIERMYCHRNKHHINSVTRGETRQWYKRYNRMVTF